MRSNNTNAVSREENLDLLISLFPSVHISSFCFCFALYLYPYFILISPSFSVYIFLVLELMLALILNVLDDASVCMYTKKPETHHT